MSGDPDFSDLYNITPGVETWIARVKDGKPALYSYYELEQSHAAEP